MPKEPKHHYIPIFYLQQWTGEDGQLVEYCRRYEGVVPRPTFPDGTGYVRGLYTLPDTPPEQAQLSASDLEYAVAGTEYKIGAASGWTKYTGPITVTQTTTVKAIAAPGK